MSTSSHGSKPVVAVMLGYYLPGHRAGGPTRSIQNLVDALGDEFSFRIITRDRDLGTTQTYADVPRGEWVPTGRAAVKYLPANLRGLVRAIRTLRHEPADVLY